MDLSGPVRNKLWFSPQNYAKIYTSTPTLKNWELFYWSLARTFRIYIILLRVQVLTAMFSAIYLIFIQMNNELCMLYISAKFNIHKNTFLDYYFVAEQLMYPNEFPVIPWLISSYTFGCITLTSHDYFVAYSTDRKVILTQSYNNHKTIKP